MACGVSHGGTNSLPGHQPSHTERSSAMALKLRQSHIVVSPQVRHFCNARLGLSERAMQTVTWPEVARRIVEVRAVAEKSLLPEVTSPIGNGFQLLRHYSIPFPCHVQCVQSRSMLHPMPTAHCSAWSC